MLNRKLDYVKHNRTLKKIHMEVCCDIIELYVSKMNILTHIEINEF